MTARRVRFKNRMSSSGLMSLTLVFLCLLLNVDNIHVVILSRRGSTAR